MDLILAVSCWLTHPDSGIPLLYKADTISRLAEQLLISGTVKQGSGRRIVL